MRGDNNRIINKNLIALMFNKLLTSKVVTRILLIFTIGFLIKAGIYYLTNLEFNYRDPKDLIGNLYSLFMACFLSFSEHFGLFAWLPSISDLYNALVNRIKLFNFDNYMKSKITTVDYKPYLCYDNNNEPSGSNSQSTGQSVNTRGPGNISPSSDTSDKDYWKEQKELYENMLATYNKDNNLLSVSDLQNKRQILDAILEAERNINFPSHDSEAVRLENLRLRLLREDEMRSESYLRFIEQKALRASALSKLEQLAEYNRANHHAIGISGIINATDKNIKPLTIDEINSIISITKKDPNLPSDLRDKISNNTIVGSIGVNHPIIKYLNDIDKK